MTSERFWVIGGDYSSLRFTALRDTPTVVGPFEDREQAKQAWKTLSREHSSRATMRFSIASEAIRLPA